MPLTKMVRKPVYKNKHAERGGKTPQKEDKMKHIIEIIVLLLTGKSKEAVDLGICDFSGQGRNKYGI